jgi:hypothetical protein
MPMSQRALCATLWLGLMCGCATRPPIAPVPSGDTVAIAVVMRLQAGGEIMVFNQAIVDDARAGATAGMVIGGVAGLACGPFMVVCIPTFAVMGAGSGGLAGTAVGVTGALTPEKAAQLRERLIRLRQAYDPLEDLRRNVTDRARRHWDLVSATPKTVVTVELYDLQLISTRDERVALVMRVLVTVRPGDELLPPHPQPIEPVGVPSSLRFGSTLALRTPPPNQKLFEYSGPPGSIAAWLDEYSDFLATSFGTACQQIAAQIVSELAAN